MLWWVGVLFWGAGGLWCLDGMGERTDACQHSLCCGSKGTVQPTHFKCPSLVCL